MFSLPRGLKCKLHFAKNYKFWLETLILFVIKNLKMLETWVWMRFLHNFWFLNETKVTRQCPIGEYSRLSNVYSIEAKYA